MDYYVPGLYNVTGHGIPQYIPRLQGYRSLPTYPATLKILNVFFLSHIKAFLHYSFGSVALQTSPIYRIVQYVKVILKEGIVLNDENTYKNL